MRMTKVLGIWATLAGLLFWNGVLGFGIFTPILGREAGEMMAAFIAMIVIFAATRPFFIEEPELPSAQAIRIGVLWAALTIVFEFSLGRLAPHVSAAMSPAFGMWDGSFWPLVVLCTGSAPMIWLRRSRVAFPRITK
jgi:hypothetical protein